MSTEATKEVVKETAKTWPDVADKAIGGLQSGLGQVAEVIKSVADHLSKAAPQVWHGLVEYHRWTSIGILAITLIYMVLGFVGVIASIKLANKVFKEEKERYSGYWLDSNSALIVFSGVGFFVSLVVLLVNLSDLPQCIGDAAVPERKAALEVINVIKSGGQLPNH